MFCNKAKECRKSRSKSEYVYLLKKNLKSLGLLANFQSLQYGTLIEHCYHDCSDVLVANMLSLLLFAIILVSDERR